jgi:hypothetical protein
MLTVTPSTWQILKFKIVDKFNEREIMWNEEVKGVVLHKLFLTKFWTDILREY